MASDDPTIVWIWATRARAMAAKAGWPDEPFGERLGIAIANGTVRARLGPLKGHKRDPWKGHWPGATDPNSPDLAERLKFWRDVKWDSPRAFARHFRSVPYDPTRRHIVDYGVSVELVEEDVQRLLGLVPTAKVVTPEGVPSPVPMVVKPPAASSVEEGPARRSAKDYQVERTLPGVARVVPKWRKARRAFRPRTSPTGLAKCSKSKTSSSLSLAARPDHCIAADHWQGARRAPRRVGSPPTQRRLKQPLPHVQVVYGRPRTSADKSDNDIRCRSCC